MMAIDAVTGFEKFDEWIENAIRALSPAGRKRLLRDIAREVRRRNQQRITRQTDPDGNKWQPRKPDRQGNIRGAKKMMLGFRKARRLQINVTPSEASVGYRGVTSRIASVHHFGAVDYVERGGPKVKYPERPLIGLPDTDLKMIRSKLIDAITEGT